jgi:toxin-antitoxin system PIN domain toxin
MLIDANILLYAVDDTSRFHARAKAWLEEVLNAPRRVALPWPVLTAFLRITTHPRALDRPLTPSAAWQFVAEWLAVDNVWIPTPTERHAEVLASLLATYDLRGNLVTDADLAALALEHGLEICSADTDFARFREVRWTNPIAAQ